jgi:hypothetical protein
MNAFERKIRDALVLYEIETAQAYNLFKSYCGGVVMANVPGRNTYTMLALRLLNGQNVEGAASDEYLYRWHLAIKTPDQCNATGPVSHDWRDKRPRACVSIFGVPHTIGM